MRTEYEVSNIWLIGTLSTAIRLSEILFCVRRVGAEATPPVVLRIPCIAGNSASDGNGGAGPENSDGLGHPVLNQLAHALPAAEKKFFGNKVKHEYLTGSQSTIHYIYTHKPVQHKC